MPLDQLERAKASTPNKPSTSHRGSMPRDHLERATKGFVAESDDVHEDDRFVVDPRDRFQVYPQESTEPPGRSSKLYYLRRKLERSKARSCPPRPIRQIQVGRTTYVLKSPVIGVFQRAQRESPSALTNYCHTSSGREPPRKVLTEKGVSMCMSLYRECAQFRRLSEMKMRACK